MTDTTLSYTGQLIVEVCWCGIHHGVPSELVEMQRRQFRDGEKQTVIYCPLGHAWSNAGEGQAVRLQRELEETKTQLVATRDQLQAAEREAARAKKRAARGICPCCKRSFVNVARHVAGQHPTYVKENR
jgi:hypothetical protein